MMYPSVTSLWGLSFLLIAAVESQRAVTIIVDWSVINPLAFGNDIILPGHAAIQIDGDANNGPLRLQIADINSAHTLDILDFGVGNVKQPIGLDASGADPNTNFPTGRKLIAAGEITLSNAEIFDLANGGSGIATDIVSDPAGPFNGQYRDGTAGCMVFVQEMLDRLFPNQPNVLYNTWVTKFQQYISNRFGSTISPDTLQITSRQIQGWGDASSTIVTELTISGHNQLTPKAAAAPQGTTEVYQDTWSLEGMNNEPVASPWDEQRPPTVEFGDGLVLTSPFANSAEGDYCKRSLHKSLHRRCAASSPDSEGIGDLAFVRVNNVLATVALVSEAAVEAAGAAATVIAAAFVILDFVHGNWVGGAFGAAGLALGILATASVAGPVGWIIGGLVAALFAILPGLFTGGENMAVVGNKTQIIQFRMFGDALHTGNEKCQEQNPNCQAVYGPGTLSAVFGWDYFDAIAFLINFNAGYPITIPDMANVFQFNGTAGAIAVVDCHNGKWVMTGRGATAGYVGDNPKWCNHPQFALNRDFILPVINQTAADVYNRIIPAPGGDCKLVDAASNAQAFPDYNITVSGLAVSIACNITANAVTPWTSVDPGDSANGTSADGTTGASTNPTNDTSTDVSPAGAATNNQGGAYVAPPGPSNFAPTFDATNGVCISSPTSDFCLPNGTYDQPTGQFGMSLNGANAVTIPTGCSITLETFSKLGRADSRPAMRTFTAAPPASSTGFADAIKNMNMGRRAGQFWIDIPATVPEPPAACFYTKTQYLGDMFCLGLGGNNFTAPGINKTQSITVGGGATVWIYAQYYGDTGGQKLTASVPDLSTEPYGTDGTFLNAVVAAWIFVAS